MWVHNINPVLLELGPLQIRWYGLVYLLGFLASWWMLNKYRHRLKLTKNDVSDLLFYIMLGVIIGARLFEVFWNPSYYLSNPLNFFKIWEGGMSFHGGFVGIIVAVYIYALKKKLDFWRVADILALPAMIALAFGRIANFINGELWGRVTDVRWCVNFKNTGGGDVCRHPSTLYAAVKRFLVAGWLYFLLKKNNFMQGQATTVRDQNFTSFRSGFIFWNFVLFEALGRFVVDFYREDVLWGIFTVGQWFSIIMILIAGYTLISRHSSDFKRII